MSLTPCKCVKCKYQGVMEGNEFNSVRFFNMTNGNMQTYVICNECFDHLVNGVIPTLTAYNTETIDRLKSDFPYDYEQPLLKIAIKEITEECCDLVVVHENTLMEMVSWYLDDIKTAMSEIEKLKINFK